MSENPENAPARKSMLVFVGMGFELVGLIVACLFIGQWIDQNYGTKGLGIAGFSILALVGWLVHLIQLLKQVEKEDEDLSKK